MGSTFGGLEISKKGLVAHQVALNTTGHNIANADNKDYARQRVKLESSEPLYAPSFNRSNSPGQLGQGVEVAEIHRVRDFFYDDQILTAENSKNFWDANQLYLTQMEHIFNEPTDNTIRSVMDKFWRSWQELANFPSDMAHREVVLERAKGLTTRVNDTFEKLNQLRNRANQEIAVDISQVNSLAAEIMDLNEKISKLEFLGDQPNDLMDKRDAAMEKMSKLVDVRVGRGSKNEMIVFIGEQAIVQGPILRKLKTEADPNNDGMLKVKWTHTEKDVILKNGHVYGLMQMRDESILSRMQEVNSFALNVADMVNEVHVDGFGINGNTNKKFFHIKPLSTNADGSIVNQNERANVDLDQDGNLDTTAIFKVSGTNKLDPDKQIGVNGVLTFMKNDKEHTLVAIDYKAEDTTNEVIKKINNSKVGVVAYMNHENHLAIKATPVDDVRYTRSTNFMIRHLEDSGEFLVGFSGVLSSNGALGAYDYRQIGEMSKLRSALKDITLTPIFNPASHFEVAGDVLRDPASLAAGGGVDRGGVGDKSIPNGSLDNANALLIAEALKQGKKMVGHSVNPEEFYNALIARLGTESRTANDAVDRYKEDLVNLNAMRQSIMGVNLDEEMSNMIQFQHAYNASAKMLQTQNELIEEIINRIKT